MNSTGTDSNTSPAGSSLKNTPGTISKSPLTLQNDEQDMVSGRDASSKVLNRKSSAAREYPAWKKRLIILVIAYASAMGPAGTTLYLPGVAQIQQDLLTSYTAVNASLAVNSFVTAIFVTFGDVFGRKNPFPVGLAIATIFSVCGGVPVNMGMLILFRGLFGVGISVCISVSAGIVTDLYEDRQQGSAFSTVMRGISVGPAIGPIIGGALTQAFGWRSTLYFIGAYCLSAWILILLFVPETCGKHNIDRCNSDEKPDRNRSSIRSLRLLRALKLFAYPNVTLMCFVCGILTYFDYFNLMAYTWIYIKKYNLRPDIFSLCYLAVPVGNIVGNYLGGRLSDRTYSRRVSQAEAQGIEPNFEMRLDGIMLGICFFVLLSGIATFGCFEDFEQSRLTMTCLQANVCFGEAIVTLSTYLLNSFESQSSAVNSCNFFVRFMLAGVREIFVSDMLAAIPTGPLYTVSGILVIPFALSIIYVKRYFLKWKRMREERTVT
ncbi:hypothetical protein VTP01DRAFT_9173 [Rhizomucor pusillus]|uniref:uncharacterized protein n=1 Tax=Rhizomucor pusillus TaxID=4840 RepID=UPI003743B70E